MCDTESVGVPAQVNWTQSTVLPALHSQPDLATVYRVHWDNFSTPKSSGTGGLGANPTILQYERS